MSMFIATNWQRWEVPVLEWNKRFCYKRWFQITFGRHSIFFLCFSEAKRSDNSLFEKSSRIYQKSIKVGFFLFFYGSVFINSTSTRVTKQICYGIGVESAMIGRLKRGLCIEIVTLPPFFIAFIISNAFLTFFLRPFPSCEYETLTTNIQVQFWTYSGNIFLI